MNISGTYTIRNVSPLSFPPSFMRNFLLVPKTHVQHAHYADFILAVGISRRQQMYLVSK